jgi:hypothetical protein
MELLNPNSAGSERSGYGSPHLIDLAAESQRDLLGNARQPQLGLHRFMATKLFLRRD